ncbi:hypothetical protein RND71_036894 [Anisodus tanguticus]|uniref:Uncharacterized protein n=1 Tax=Anisodus tanguticus TaxID=243964 RepID=A0AAE1R210_9SOLA|nr:hypothetical protein RND71_036894 [Anisodus tanguticus]
MVEIIIDRFAKESAYNANKPNVPRAHLRHLKTWLTLAQHSAEHDGAEPTPARNAFSLAPLGFVVSSRKGFFLSPDILSTFPAILSTKSVNIGSGGRRESWGKSAFPSRKIQSSHGFPYGYLVTTSPRSKTPPWYAPIRPPKAFVALVCHEVMGDHWSDASSETNSPGCDGRCVHGPVNIHRGMRSAITSDSNFMFSSCERTIELRQSFRIRSALRLASHYNCHCSTCVARPIRAMRIGRHPHLPPHIIRQSFVSTARTFLFVSEPFVWAGRTKPTMYHTTGWLARMPSLSLPSTRRRRHTQDKAKNVDFTKQARKALSILLVKRASRNKKIVLTRNRKCFERRRLPSYRRSTARCGTQLVAPARHSAPRLTSVAKTFSLGACLKATQNEGFARYRT